DGSNGAASVTASGGTPGYSYLWSTTAITSSISSLSAGTYTVTVTDANGCTASCESIVTQSSSIIASCTATPASCFGGSNGTASVTVSGGTPGYFYLWSTTEITSSISSLSAGTYTVTVTDANGCTATCESIVLEPSAVIASCSATPASCFDGSNGTASVTASGGTPAYSYLWSTTEITSSISSLSAVTYTVTVTDFNGCTATCESIVTQPSAVVASCNATPASCFGSNNGAASVNANGGTPGYSYLWSSTEITSSISGLSAGTYTVTVTDANGCTGTCEAIVTQSSSVVLSYSTTPVSCPGGSDGTITVTATGGSSPYQYSNDNGTLYQSSNVFTGLAPGNYDVIVKDANNCLSSTTIVTIGTTTDATAPVPDVTTLPTVTGECSATVTVSPTATDNCSGSISGTTIDPLAYSTQGTFTVHWTYDDGNGNTSTQNQTVIVDDITNPVISNCPGSFSSCNPVTWASPAASDNCGSVVLTSNYNPGGNLPSGTTTVIYTADDGNGNTTVCSFDVTVIPPPSSIISGNSTICLGQPAIIHLVFTGTGPWDYIISDGVQIISGSSTNNPDDINIIPVSGGNHVYTVTDLNDASCTGSGSGSATITVNSVPPNTTITSISGASDACSGQVSLMTANSSGGSGFNYSWNTGTNSSIVMFSNNSGGPFSNGPFTTTGNTVYAQFGALVGASGYNVCVQAFNACGSSANKCNWIRGKMGTPGTIVGSSVACSNDTKNYSCGVSGGNAVYNWTFSVAGAVITNNGTLNVQVTYPTFTAGQLCVTAALACGGSSTSAPRCLTITNAPIVPGAFTSGPSKVCPGATNVLFTVPASNSASGYNWTVPVGASIVETPPFSTSIHVNFPTPYTGAPPVCVYATSSCASSVGRCKAVGSNIPTQPGAMSGPTTNICNSTVQYSVSNVA
ncbi:MAG: HYR domain-containing protein, partial [Bacteroidota bacterium]